MEKLNLDFEKDCVVVLTEVMPALNLCRMEKESEALGRLRGVAMTRLREATRADAIAAGQQLANRFFDALDPADMGDDELHLAMVTAENFVHRAAAYLNNRGGTDGD